MECVKKRWRASPDAETPHNDASNVWILHKNTKEKSYCVDTSTNVFNHSMKYLIHHIMMWKKLSVLSISFLSVLVQHRHMTDSVCEANNVSVKVILTLISLGWGHVPDALLQHIWPRQTPGMFTLHCELLLFNTYVSSFHFSKVKKPKTSRTSHG